MNKGNSAPHLMVPILWTIVVVVVARLVVVMYVIFTGYAHFEPTPMVLNPESHYAQQLWAPATFGGSGDDRTGTPSSLSLSVSVLVCVSVSVRLILSFWSSMSLSICGFCK